MAGRHHAQVYATGVCAGDRVMLSQAITLIESTRESDMTLAAEVSQLCLPHTGRSFRIGITGPPGVGKSTFIEALGSYLTRSGHTVAVLAIDPSSTRTRGSILGDKTRMTTLARDPQAYIRPSPSGGSLGGVARQTRDTLLLCEAAGFDIILVETVGVGQSETAVSDMVDFFLLLALPHAGDELQGIKKGIMETADGIVVHKADGELLARARSAAATLRQALRYFPPGDAGLRPEVLLCSSLTQTGIDEVWRLLQAYRSHTVATGYWELRRQRQRITWVEEALRERLERTFFRQAGVSALWETLRPDVQDNTCAPAQAVELLIQAWQTQRGEMP
ncbi:MAG: methylmalonyl Co-A mutase-associated GTPase MeaB [Bacteroidia bacterium]|nr:methylmalonyl Co-A mutase-associated GTPase MeaB [Bacteroidia bacterium]